MRPEPINPLPPAPLRRRVHASPGVCRREHAAPKERAAPARTPEAPDAGPISFWRYLEKHNREDRVDLSRTALASRSERPEEGHRTPAVSYTRANDRLARAYNGNPMPRLGDVMDARG